MHVKALAVLFLKETEAAGVMPRVRPAFSCLPATLALRGGQLYSSPKGIALKPTQISFGRDGGKQACVRFIAFFFLKEQMLTGLIEANRLEAIDRGV